jgi:potassium-transporting ATPase KdpC subunit
MHTTHIRPAASLLLLMTLLCGVAYPLVVTGIAQLVFPAQAQGSLLYEDGRLIGSRLIGQSFANPGHFWGRPSATTPQPYNALGSSGSNLGPLNPALIDQVKTNAKRLRDADPDNQQPIPVELVTASASGLDPEISRAAADYQAARVARVRGLQVAAVQALIASHAQDRALGYIGEPRVNVLELNLALDKLR